MLRKPKLKLHDSPRPEQTSEGVRSGVGVFGSWLEGGVWGQRLGQGLGSRFWGMVWGWGSGHGSGSGGHGSGLGVGVRVCRWGLGSQLGSMVQSQSLGVRSGSHGSGLGSVIRVQKWGLGFCKLGAGSGVMAQGLQCSEFGGGVWDCGSRAGSGVRVL